ncbi:MAG: hypothetical protein AAF939_04560 [Planctomycetota bacterium]
MSLRTGQDFVVDQVVLDLKDLVLEVVREHGWISYSTEYRFDEQLHGFMIAWQTSANEGLVKIVFLDSPGPPQTVNPGPYRFSWLVVEHRR